MSDGLIIIRKLLVDKKRSFTSIRREVLLEEEQIVYDYVMERLKEDGEYPDPSIVEEETGIELPEGKGSLKVYMGRLADRTVYEAIFEHLPDIQRAAKEENGLVDKLRPHFQALDRACSLADPKNELAQINDSMEAVRQDMYERLYLGAPRGVTTGYDDLDRHYGGHKKSDLNLLVARPNLGKTYAALRNAMYAFNTHRDSKVLFITPEMSTDMVIYRQLFLLTGIDTEVIAENRVSMHQRAMLTRAMEVLDSWQGFFVTQAKDTQNLIARINELRPDFVVPDGIYMLRPQNYHARMDMQSKALAVVEEIKEAAISFDVPVFATTQFNRQAGKGGKFGSMENIGYTGGFEQYCSNIWGYQPGDVRQSIVDYNLRTWVCHKTRERAPWDFLTHYKFTPKNFAAIDFFKHVDREEEERRNGRRGNRGRPNVAPVQTPAQYAGNLEDEDE